MSDIIKGLTVVLEPNMRAEEAYRIIQAIKQLRGVVSVGFHVAEPDHYMAVATAKFDIRGKIWDLLTIP